MGFTNTISPSAAYPVILSTQGFKEQVLAVAGASRFCLSAKLAFLYFLSELSSPNARTVQSADSSLQWCY